MTLHRSSQMSHRMRVRDPCVSLRHHTSQMSPPHPSNKPPLQRFAQEMRVLVLYGRGEGGAMDALDTAIGIINSCRNGSRESCVCHTDNSIFLLTSHRAAVSVEELRLVPRVVLCLLRFSVPVRTRISLLLLLQRIHLRTFASVHPHRSHHLVHQPSAAAFLHRQSARAIVVCACKSRAVAALQWQ